ncbi:MAG: aa3-type cytochrome c oxidase subunit IV [Methylocystis sp.]
MASIRTPMESNGDWAEHVRTYKTFLLLLKITAASTAALLLGLFFFVAR